MVSVSLFGGMDVSLWMNPDTIFRTKTYYCVCFFLCVFEGMMFFSSGDPGILRKQNAGIIF